MGFLFRMGQSQANEWIHRLTPLLNVVLGYEQQLPARQAANLEQLLAQCPELEFIIDGTERPIQRPQDPQRQREHYSGKKKRPTVKNIVVLRNESRRSKGWVEPRLAKNTIKPPPMRKSIVFPKIVTQLLH